MRDGGVMTLAHETKEHLHSYLRCFGSDGANGGDPATMTPYTATSDDDTDPGPTGWGAWIALLDANDTPQITSPNTSLYFEAQEILVSDASKAAITRMQIGYGASGAAALSAQTYTEFMFISTVGVFHPTSIKHQAKRHPVATPVWARIWIESDGAAGSTVSFFLYEHEYDE